ncbi:5'-deoxynucleotidase [Lachancea thermotolerans CBS 6340]|uniref:5'-deoxynucleotidase n=1 Tax=Lachancea thermotolerans (strain ATCC 56472 / CBS 6340 / NRRL Y-8284) TaxID=559295 RepID=C5E2K2_LACTC|nr:KLTH0H05654p [Lachancea thermotolerans CBS 6340]CAR30263.1 KLTH0H05654p [Lachancea thermotolerans CBS 6340]
MNKFIGSTVFNRLLTRNTRMTAPVWKPQDHVPQEVKDLLQSSGDNHVLAFLHIVQLLKVQRRTGWLDHNISPCESIADHMYRMGITAMLIRDPKINRDKCVRIALVHDIAEALVGDITPLDPVGKEEKHRREWETIQYLCEDLVKPYNAQAAQEIMDDWLAYENIASPEARYVKDIDKFEMLVQCFEYEKLHNGKRDLDQFWGAMSSIKTEEVKGWAQDLLQKREQFYNSLKK